MPAAIAVQAAERQGKGRALSRPLFEHYRAFDDAKILELANQVGLDLNKFKTDLTASDVKEEVADDLEATKESKMVRGAPTVLVNGAKILARTDPDLQAIIDDEIKRADDILASGVDIDHLYVAACK